MKQYIKYIILFIILIFVGIVGVNLYNNKNFQDSTKTTPKVTSKEKNNTNPSTKTKQDEKTNTEEKKETNEDTKKTTEENTTDSTKNNKNETTTSNVSSNTQSSSSTNHSSSSSTSNSNSTQSTSPQSNSSTTNTSNNSNNSSSNTAQKSSSGYNVLEVDPSTNTQSSTNNNFSSSSISTYDNENNSSMNRANTTQDNNTTNTEVDHIIDVEIDNSSPTKNTTESNTSSNNSDSNSNSNSSSSNNTSNNKNNTDSNNTSNNTTSTDQTIIKDGDVIGATGYGAVPSVNVLRTKPNSNSTVITRIELNTPFRIIGKSSNGNWWRVKYKGKYGYVDNNYCLINLPDYIPSITYYIVDAEKDNSVSSGVKLSIYGKKLYTAGKVYNSRLERDEYIVPVTYTFAKKILKAQKLALKDGYSLKIYDAYRPTSVAIQVRDSLAELYNSNATVRKNINYSFENGNTYEWGKSWFIAQNLSAHSLASAIDVSLTKKGETKSLKMPSKMNELSAKSIKYRYGVSGQTTVRNDLYSSNMTPAAKKLDAYMMNSGLTSLASEWWHFQDNVSYSRMKEYIPNGLNFQPTKIVSKKIN